MSDARALEEIKRLVALGHVVFTRHARQRMDERGARATDVCNALSTATSATLQTDRDNWRVDGGVDHEGDGMTVIVDIEADVIVVTLF